MEEDANQRHVRSIQHRCRVCGKYLKKKFVAKRQGESLRKYCNKVLFKGEFQEHWRVNVTQENEDVHPELLCRPCEGSLYRLRKGKEQPPILRSWTPHTEEGCFCEAKPSTSRGKKRGLSEEDTDSGEEAEGGTDGTDVDFRTITESLPFLNSDQAGKVAKQLSERHGFILISKSDIDKSLVELPRSDLLQITEAIFRNERQGIKLDASRCSQTYKNIQKLVSLDSSEWSARRNSVISSALKGLSTPELSISREASNLLEARKAIANDHLYSLVHPGFIGPISFPCNLLMYSIARSKLCCNVYGKLYPGGSFGSLKAWLDKLTLKIPEYPAGDLLTAIDNDQVLIKKWTVREENRAQISILTSVCTTTLNPSGNLQQDRELHPGKWDNRCKLAKENPSMIPNLMEECTLTQEQHNLLRQENKNLIQDLLYKIAKEHTIINGVPRDDDDGLTYLVSRDVVQSVRLCSACGVELLASETQSHFLEKHIGETVNFIKEFDWAFIRIGKLHMEMNMARCIMSVQWDVYMSSLAHELGFMSEAAQKFAKKGSDHHKTIVYHEGGPYWYSQRVVGSLCKGTDADRRYYVGESLPLRMDSCLRLVGSNISLYVLNYMEIPRGTADVQDGATTHNTSTQGSCLSHPYFTGIQFPNMLLLSCMTGKHYTTMYLDEL
ncbi:uncharacterized protein LOC116619443 [Nematostella vectensis]|uniref:uncharacterized protein LOC116619443 n=1 Tax=Nematostella vectensis TaxID=45351 RepID=UPI0020779615|nr:uncharacterized protein LOC116619443 [Nematostella vectensis]